jgi:exopolyphosphatase/pppGpp-phosphohydrolase
VHVCSIQEDQRTMRYAKQFSNTSKLHEQARRRARDVCTYQRSRCQVGRW